MASMENTSKKRVEQKFLNFSFYIACVRFLITALGLWLDTVSCAFVACVCFSFIIMSQDTSSSNVGLAISQSLILTGMVQYGIRQMMESFQLFTNAERVLQYTKLEQEPLISRKPTKDWPFKGKAQITLVRVFFQAFFDYSLPSSIKV